jgi:redox-sensitive bicupin YhaK (pirin superfamily)
MHGLQIWVALPKHLEQMNPEFFHVEAEKLPEWTTGNVDFKLVAGEIMGHNSPVPVYSNLYMLEIKSRKRQKLNIGDHLFGESGLYIMEGGIESEGNRYGPKQILVAKDSTLCEFTIEADSTIYIFGGDPFPEERFIDWNFVSSRKELIEEAKQKWITQQFEKIKGDEVEYVPYPTLKR